MERGALQAIVHRVTKSWTQLSGHTFSILITTVNSYTPLIWTVYRKNTNKSSAAKLYKKDALGL